MSQAATTPPTAQQWLRYWRNSLADAESGRGVLDKEALGQTDYLERTVYRDGRLILADPPVIHRDLLAPQADDRFTINDVAEQNRFLSKSGMDVEGI